MATLAVAVHRLIGIQAAAVPAAAIPVASMPGVARQTQGPVMPLVAKRLMSFLSLLEAKLPPSRMKPNITAVQRRVLENGVAESRPITFPREKGWVPCLALSVPVIGEWLTLFLEDSDLEKPPAKLVKECLAIIEKHTRAQQYGVSR